MDQEACHFSTPSYVRLAILQKKYLSKFGLKIKLGKKDLEELILRAAAA